MLKPEFTGQFKTEKRGVIPALFIAILAALRDIERYLRSARLLRTTRVR